MKNILKYIPILGIWIGLPFIKNPTIPTDEKTHQIALKEQFLGMLYHFVSIIVIISTFILI